MTKDEIYKLIQVFLNNPPVVIWGSGATIAYGLPSMDELNKILKDKYDFFDKTNTNLEEELGKPKYEPMLNEIRKTIWDYIYEKDNLILNDTLMNPQNYTGIKILVEKFTQPHPHVFNIITTNYDRVLENIISINNCNFTDGFSGRMLSAFDEELFQTKTEAAFINLIKVHGSLNWFEVDGQTRYFNKNEIYEPQIIPPGKNKYRQAFSDPYRSLIQISDKKINNSKSLLVIGFGFNDEHITPKITNQIRKGIPIVIISKKITDTTKEELTNALCYLTLEEENESKTKMVYKKKNDKEEHTEIIDGSLWKLDKFMEAL